MSGGLGGAPAGSNHQPPTSEERLGSHQGERQLSHWGFLLLCQLFLLPFVSLSAETLSAPPSGLFVTNHWRLHYPPSTISSFWLLNAAPKEGVHHRLPWHRAGLGGGVGAALAGPSDTLAGWRQRLARPEPGGVHVSSWCSLPECAGFCQVSIQATQQAKARCLVLQKQVTRC